LWPLIQLLPATYVRQASHRAGSFVRETTWVSAKGASPEYEEFTVPAVNLPKLLADYGFESIDLLKIDAEGVEGEILLSLKAAGGMPRVHWIRREWHGREDWPRIEVALRNTHDFHLQPTAENGELIAHNRADV
jgi:hypothetical protein